MNIKEEYGLETLDSGGSKVFAITDHQIAHIYLQDNDSTFRSKVIESLESMDGVATILEGDKRKQAGLEHSRAEI